MGKLTIEEVRAEFEVRGWNLLSNDYVGIKIPLDAICKNNHRQRVTLKSLKQSKSIHSGCQQCAGNIKLDIEKAREIFKTRGMTLTESEYINNETQMSFVCQNGHRGMATLSGVSKSISGCFLCSHRSPPSIEYVRREFKRRGLTLTSKIYLNNKKPLNFICESGHEHYISWRSFRDGSSCEKCFGTPKLKIEDIREAFTRRGWQLLSTEYINAHEHLDFICDRGHNHKIQWAHFRQESGCRWCVTFRFKKNVPMTLYYVRFTYNSVNYYKIGISTNTVKRRFAADKIPFKVISTTPYLFGYLAFEEEQKILTKYHKFRYKGVPFLRGGNTELFTKDVLGLDAN